MWRGVCRRRSSRGCRRSSGNCARSSADHAYTDCMMDPSQINWLAVVVAALITFVLGGLWYSPLLFGKVWQRLNKLSDDELKRASMGKIFGGAAICAAVAAANLAFFVGPTATVAFGAFAGFAAGA